MRKLMCLFAFTAALLTIGCSLVLEDDDNCPPKGYNLVLQFSNTDNNGSEIFDSSIDKVEIFLFDRSNRLAYRFDAPQAELAASKSASLKVTPGIYRVVCWGNAKSNTVINMAQNSLFVDGYIYKNVPDGGTTTENGNQLYYAPYDCANGQFVTVPANRVKEETVRFRAAHIKMQFAVNGYAAHSGTTANPYVEITNLFPKYDFSMAYMPTPALNYIQQTSATTRADDITYAQFSTPRFEKENQIVINLRENPASAPLISLNLTQELDRLGITNVSDHIELILSFLIEFKGGTDVTIGIDKWTGGGLNPEIH